MTVYDSKKWGERERERKLSNERGGEGREGVREREILLYVTVYDIKNSGRQERERERVNERGGEWREGRAGGSEREIV